MFVIEKGESPEAFEDMENSKYSSYIFSNIKELQEKNIELLSKLNGYEEEKNKTIAKHQNAE